MWRCMWALIMMLLLISSAFAQQDPNDPGQPDSLIVQSVELEPGAIFANVAVWAVTDDSVGHYRMPLAWYAPLGGIRVAGNTLYFPPLTSWNIRYDTIMYAESRFLLMGFCESFSGYGQPMHTNNQRQHIISLRFVIDPDTPAQVVRIDTFATLVFGLTDDSTGFTPAFVPGYITVRGPSNADEAAPPREFALSQNYPNPFNAQTTISYSLSEPGHVTLSIYNITGQRVATLVDGMEEAGEHRVVWEAEEVSSGVYLGKLEMEDRTNSIRMVLLK